MKNIPTKFAVSSEFLDNLIKYILDKDMKEEIQIPSKLTNRIPYGRRLSEEYRQEDLDHLLAYIDTFKFTSLELAVLDNLAVWTFRNSGTLVRSAIGLIGATLAQLLTAVSEPGCPVVAPNPSGLTDKFMNESSWTIRRVIRNSIAIGPIEAKLPLREMEREIAILTSIGKDQTPISSLEKARLHKILPLTAVDADITQDGDRMDYMAKMLVQLTRAVHEYKREEDFGKLRSFMTNCIHVSTMIRVFSSDKDVVRLAGDVLDQTHSVDRLLSSNCIAATSLMDRMSDGELVYDEILDMGKHQHRIMAVEVASVISLFSYLVSQSRDLIRENTDVYKMFSKLIRYSGVGTRYTNEIQTVNGL